MTYTYALLGVPQSVYDLIREKLHGAGYLGAGEDEVIDMHGLALVVDEDITHPGLNLKKLREINVARSNRWHEDEAWNVSDWAVAFAGEAGEACNAVKKLRRLETFVRRAPNDLNRKEAIKKIAQEVADTVLYADLLLAHLGVDLSQALIETFNRKSEDMGFPERLS